ncbi:hypothetical protein HZS_3617 [Henneguya salminicola]|nr:hypothetical protein HZS_3617 [Henneguya salminicola]
MEFAQNHIKIVLKLCFKSGFDIKSCDLGHKSFRQSNRLDYTFVDFHQIHVPQDYSEIFIEAIIQQIKNGSFHYLTKHFKIRITAEVVKLNTPVDACVDTICILFYPGETRDINQIQRTVKFSYFGQYEIYDMRSSFYFPEKDPYNLNPLELEERTKLYQFVDINDFTYVPVILQRDNTKYNVPLKITLDSSIHVPLKVRDMNSFFSSFIHVESLDNIPPTAVQIKEKEKPSSKESTKTDNIKIKKCSSFYVTICRVGYIIFGVINFFLISIIISLIIQTKLRTRSFACYYIFRDLCIFH